MNQVDPAEDRRRQWEIIRADAVNKLKAHGIEVSPTAAGFEISGALFKLATREFAIKLGMPGTSTDDEVQAKNNEMNAQAPGSADVIFREVDAKIREEFKDYYSYWKM